MRGKIVEKKLTHVRLLEVLDYDPASGIFTWRISRSSNVKPGTVAGKNNTGNGYRYIGIDFFSYSVAQLSWFYVTGEWPRTKIQFKNGNPTDCSFENLVLSKGVHGEFDFQTREGKTAYLKAYRKANPEREKARSLRGDFGLSLADYRRMSDAQGNACAICGKPETEIRGSKVKALAVDHDHETGAIRGLLCSPCNKSIGAMCDDPEILRAAASYIESYRPSKGIDPMDFYTGDLSSALCYGGG